MMFPLVCAALLCLLLRLMDEGDLYVSMIFLLAVAVALTIGCPVLGMIFGADLSGNRFSLTILMVGGGMLALANFFTVVVTVVRGQKHLLAGYILGALTAKLLSGYFVRTYGVPGASLFYTFLMTLISLIFAVVFTLCVRKGIKQMEIKKDAS